MAKQYYIKKKNPTVSGLDIEWVALNGKEFYQLITSPAGRGRYFIDMDEFMIESTLSSAIRFAGFADELGRAAVPIFVVSRNSTRRISYE